MPLQTTIYQNHVLVIQYSLWDDIHFKYSFFRETVPREITLKGNNAEESVAVFDPNVYILYKIYHFKYYVLNPIIEEYEKYDERKVLFVITLSSASGFCDGLETKTQVQISFHQASARPNTTLENCNDIFIFREHLHMVSIDLWPSEVVSLLEISDTQQVFHKITVRDTVDLDTDSNDGFLFNLWNFYGIFFCDARVSKVTLKLVKLPPKLYSFNITGRGHETSSMAVNVNIRMRKQEVTLFYETNDITLSLDLNKVSSYDKASLIIESMQYVHIVYVKIIDIRSIYHEYPWVHETYYERCHGHVVGINKPELQSLDANMFLYCELRIKRLRRRTFSWDEIWVGTFDNYFHFYQGRFNNMLIEEVYFGPVIASPEQAKAYCKSIGMKLLNIVIFGYWMQGLEKLESKHLGHYAFWFWVIDFHPINEISKDEMHINCESLKYLDSLPSVTLTSCYNRSSCGPERVEFHLQAYIVRHNIRFFCQGISLPNNYMNILIPTKFISSYILLYVPPNEKLRHAGFICETNSRTKEILAWEIDANDPLIQKAYPAFYEINPLKIHNQFFYIQAENNFEKRAKFVGSLNGALFECEDHIMLPNYYVCNGIKNCVEGLDEINCTGVCSTPYAAPIEDCYTDCLKPACTCGHLYFQCQL